MLSRKINKVDITKINNSSKVFIAADKTRNIYELNRNSIKIQQTIQGQHY